MISRGVSTRLLLASTDQARKHSAFRQRSRGEAHLFNLHDDIDSDHATESTSPSDTVQPVRHLEEAVDAGGEGEEHLQGNRRKGRTGVKVRSSCRATGGKGGWG